MSIQKLNEILRTFEIKKQDFCQIPKVKYLKVMYQKFPFGGLIGYEKSCMDYSFANSKVFRLHAILHDSAGSAITTTKKRPGYCYVAPSLPSSCFLSHVTGKNLC